MVRVTKPTGRSATSRDEEPPVPEKVVRVAQWWVRVANDLLWYTQRKLSAMCLRDLWSSFGRMSNKLRKSSWEAYREEFGFIVRKNRKGAPKAKPGESSRAKVVEGHGLLLGEEEEEDEE